MNSFEYKYWSKELNPISIVRHRASSPAIHIEAFLVANLNLCYKDCFSHVKIPLNRVTTEK